MRGLSGQIDAATLSARAAGRTGQDAEPGYKRKRRFFNGGWQNALQPYAIFLLHLFICS